MKKNLLVDRFLEKGIHVCGPASEWLHKCGYKATKKDFEKFWRACRPEWIGWLVKECAKRPGFPLGFDSAYVLWYEDTDGKIRSKLRKMDLRRSDMYKALGITR
jgi:hypothetical protein